MKQIEISHKTEAKNALSHGFLRRSHSIEAHILEYIIEIITKYYALEENWMLKENIIQYISVKNSERKKYLRAMDFFLYISVIFLNQFLPRSSLCEELDLLDYDARKYNRVLRYSKKGKNMEDCYVDLSGILCLLEEQDLVLFSFLGNRWLSTYYANCFGALRVSMSEKASYHEKITSYDDYLINEINEAYPTCQG